MTSSLEPARPNKWLIAAVLALFVIRLYVAMATGLVDDEAYYRIWGLAPALSYLDHPPMVGWMIALSRAIAGDGELGVRLFAPLFGLLGPLILWRTAYLLYGARIADRAAWFVLAMPLLAVGGIIITPDLPSSIFAGLVLWALAELDRSQNANWWLAVGVFAGCGLLSKYTNLFIGASILLWVLALPQNRRWLCSPALWIGGALALAVASPVAIWNAQHDWASFSKQFGRVGRSGTQGPFYLLEMLGTVLILASPVIAVLAASGLWRAARRGISERTSADVMLVAFILPMLAYFAVHGLHDRVQGNWLAPIYPPLAIAAALALGALGEPWQKRIFAAALAVGFAISAIIYAHALTGFLGNVARKSPTEQMVGWDDLALKLDQSRSQSGAKWIATSSYATTGQLAFALRGKAEVIQLDERLRYIHLPPVEAELSMQPALYVELERRVDLPLLQKKFSKIVPLGSLKRDNGTREAANYLMFLVSDPAKPPV